jgi:hypothetical protein
VICRSTHRGGNFLPAYEVEFRNGSSLLIPIAATEWEDSLNNRTKLSIDALQDLVVVMECFDSDESKSNRSVDDTAGAATTPDRRGRRRGLGGDLS